MLLAVLALAGCEAQRPAEVAVSAPPAMPSAPSAPTAPSSPSEPSEEGRVFGTAPSSARPITPLATILAEPARFADQTVRTEGEIARVCQRMGCWMELRENAAGPAVRVPMAGHSFFLPRDVSGRHAMLEGRVQVEELSAEHRAHLESEGAQATASALAIHATGVVVR